LITLNDRDTAARFCDWRRQDTHLILGNRHKASSMTAMILCALIGIPLLAQGATLSDPPQMITPKPKIPQPQIKLPPPPPPLTIKSAPPQQVIVPGLQPGKVIEIALVGGKGPIQIAIDAGVHSQLFSVARRPTSTGRKSPQQPINQFQIGAANSIASADEFLGIRYAGVAATGQMASQIPLTIRATDAAGSTVSAAMTVYPVDPQITIASNQFNNVIAKQAITVTVNLDRLPPGVSVLPLANRVYENLTVAETNCFFLTNGAGVSAVADLAGRVTFQIQGSFGVRGSVVDQVHSCTFALEFAVGGSQRAAHSFVFEKTNIGLVAPVRYTLENTNAVKSQFNFLPSNGSGGDLGGTFGTCSGTSYGVEAVSVGMVDAGNDVAFRIRSGPIGTGCEWRSQRVDVADGLRLVAMNWEVSKVGSKCCSGAFTNCEPEKRINAINSEAVPMVDKGFFGIPLDDGGGAFVAEQINGQRYSTKRNPDWGKSYFMPLTVRLRCDPTLVNDHGITLRLTSIVLEGPPGRKFP